MMLTEQCLDHLNLNLEDTHIQMEEYEHLGEIKTSGLTQGPSEQMVSEAAGEDNLTTCHA
jgi:hypothetical protein